MSMTFINGLLVVAAASIISASPVPLLKSTPSRESAQPGQATCKPTLGGEEAKNTRETFDAIRKLKKDGAAGVSAEAQAILDQMKAMYENDDSRGSAEMADAMREFAGGRAPRRQRC